MEIKILDKTFVPYISEKEIQSAIQQMASSIEKDFRNDTPVFLAILNGSFMVISDLMKHYKANCEVSFTKLSSYDGTKSNGVVHQLIGIDIDLTNKNIIVVEDIIETGNTLKKIVDELKNKHIKSLKIATLFLKPNLYKLNIPIDYIGMEISDEFIVGYGLDYNKQGRNIPSIYQIKK